MLRRRMILAKFFTTLHAISRPSQAALLLLTLLSANCLSFDFRRGAEMSLFRNAAKSSPVLTKMAHQQLQGLPSLLRFSTHRLFSTDAPQPSQEAATVDPFLQTPRSVYARLIGTTRHTSKTDVLNMLDGCNLRIDDIKFEYDQNYGPLPALLRFPSQQAYEAGIKTIVRRGRFRLERNDGYKWDSIVPLDGKAVLVQGIPPNTSPEDIERFLSGCTYDASSIQIFTRRTRMALVRFPSPALAMHSFITKNRGFVLNNQVLLRVLY